MVTIADTQVPGGAVQLPLATLLSGALFIAFAPILVRFSELEPVATALYRLIVAAPILCVWAFQKGRSARPARLFPQPRPVGLRDGILMVLAGAFLAADLAVWHVSITMTSVANATVFNNCAPIFIALFAWIFLGERIGVGFLAALAVAAAGMFLMIGDNLHLEDQNLLGDALAISTGLFYGAYILLVKHLRERHTTATIMAVTSTAGIPVLLACTLISGEGLVPASAGGICVLVILGLLCHVGGQSLIAHALAILPATFSSVGLLLQPLGAAVLAWLLFGEALSIWHLLGGALVLTSILLARRATSP